MLAAGESNGIDPPFGSKTAATAKPVTCNWCKSSASAANTVSSAKLCADRLLDAIHYFTIHNITWRALPAEFGKWNSVWKPF